MVDQHGTWCGAEVSWLRRFESAMRYIPSGASYVILKLFFEKVMSWEACMCLNSAAVAQRA